MISKKMENMVANSSAIRAMFEEGNRLAKIYGAENVYDFSLGNPNVPAPEAVKKAMIDILNEEDPIVLHGYTNSNAGYEDVVNGNYDTQYNKKSYLGSIHSFNHKYDLQIVFMKERAYTPIYIYGVMQYYLRGQIR